MPPQGGSGAQPCLQQRYSLSARRLVAALRQSNGTVLAVAGKALEAREAALAEELGRDGRALVGAMLGTQARALSCSVALLRQRAQALLEVHAGHGPAWWHACLPACQRACLPKTCPAPVAITRPPGCVPSARPAAQVFTRGQLQQLELGPLAFLLNSKPATWQLALAVWRALGVADPATLALNNMQPLTYDRLTGARLANLLALQRSLGLPSEAAVVQRFAGYVACCAPERLAGRLLFLQQERLTSLLVVRARGETPPKDAPPRISVRDVVMLLDARFRALAALPRDAAACYAAFMEDVRAGNCQPYQQLLAEAAAWARQLAAEHPEVAHLAAERAAGEGGKEELRLAAEEESS